MTENNTATVTATSNFKENLNSPNYNYYLNYSMDSPLTTDSSTTPFTNNKTTGSNNKLDSTENFQFPINNQIAELSLPNDTYLSNNPSNESSTSLSSSTTKLNTANNSTANLSKLNFRLNYITSTTNPSDNIISNSNTDGNNNNNNNNLVSINENNKNNSLDPSSNSNIDGSTLTNDSPINNLSSPSVMNDLLELLDAKETEKQQRDSASKSQQTNNMLNTTTNNNNNNNNKPFSFLDDSSPLASQYNTENNFVQLDNVFENDILPINRRTSVVVSNKFPNLTNTRNSISHNVDFWNMDSEKSKEIDPSYSMDIDPISTDLSNNVLNISNDKNLDTNSIPIQSIDDNVTQMLSGYNMDFSKNIRKSNNTINETPTNNNNNHNNSNKGSNVTSTNFNNFLYSPKQDVPRRQSTSIPFISDSLYNSLYGNGNSNGQTISSYYDNNNSTSTSSRNNSNSNNNNNNIDLNPKFGSNFDNGSLSTLNNDDFNMTAFKNNLFDNDTINTNGSTLINNNILSTSGDQRIDKDAIINNSVNEFLNQLNDTSKEQKFIKPSMMLSEKASMAAKLAVKGIPKVDTFPTIDTQPYNHPTKITKRKSVSSMAPIGTNSHKHSYTNTRRKSTIGMVRSSTSMTPNVSNSSSTNKKNSLSGPASRSHSTDSENIEEKPFQCAECPKAFKRSEHLKRHIRSVHSNERPFPCTLCEKKFSRSDNLSQHLKTHKKHGDF